MVVGFSLDKDGTGVDVQAFVKAPYDKYVGTNTRWWHASGVDLRLDSSGLKLNTQSLATVIVGGLAFQSPPGQPEAPQAADNAPFRLASDEADAMRDPDGTPLMVVMRFDQSLRGRGRRAGRSARHCARPSRASASSTTSTRATSA